MAEIKASFFLECEELIEALQDGLETMQDGTSDDEIINTVFRAVHSIKGGAGAFGLEDLVRFAHRFESVLDGLRSGALLADDGALKVFFKASDHLSDLVAAAADARTLPDAQSNDLMAALDGLAVNAVSKTVAAPEIAFKPKAIDIPRDLETDSPFELPQQSEPRSPDLTDGTNRYQITFTPSFELFESGNEPALLLACLQELGDTHIQCDVSQVPDLENLSPEMPHLSWRITLDTQAAEAEIASLFEFVEGLCTLAISQTDPQAIPPKAAGETPLIAPGVDTRPKQSKPVVRVDLERIEQLVNLVGELVINQAMLSQSLEKAKVSPHSDTKSSLDEFQRLTRDIQESVMMIRAQPVKSLFQRMSRIVREASASIGKDARLVMSGDATEVDKTVIERLVEPLTHLVRNAVDHGLEDPSTRTAAGKSAQGQVQLSAAHRSGRVIIEVSDDGAGIDRDKVLRIAREKGLVAPDIQLSDTDIDNLLFLPGFSTVSEVSDLSGRGVGMDVVRTDINALGGQVTIQSDPASGTRFTISLPLTLAVLDGMVIEVATQTLVLPLTLVIETLTLGPADVQMMRPGHPVVQVRGQFVPIIDLGRVLGYRSALRNFDGAVALLISNENGKTAALIVDDILDQRQVVIKGLNDSLYRAPGIAAATILGDGQIALILDPSDIISHVQTPMPSDRTPKLEEAQA